jgi:hypothetical protein
MNPEWLCYVNGQEYGPYTWPQLVQMAAAGNVLPSTHVRRNFDSQWYTAEQVPGLFTAPGAAVTPQAAAHPTTPPRIAVAGVGKAVKSKSGASPVAVAAAASPGPQPTAVAQAPQQPPPAYPQQKAVPKGRVVSKAPTAIAPVADTKPIPIAPIVVNPAATTTYSPATTADDDEPIPGKRKDNSKQLVLYLGGAIVGVALLGGAALIWNFTRPPEAPKEVAAAPVILPKEESDPNVIAEEATGTEANPGEVVKAVAKPGAKTNTTAKKTDTAVAATNPLVRSIASWKAIEKFGSVGAKSGLTCTKMSAYLAADATGRRVSVRMTGGAVTPPAGEAIDNGAAASVAPAADGNVSETPPIAAPVIAPAPAAPTGPVKYVSAEAAPFLFVELTITNRDAKPLTYAGWNNGETAALLVDAQGRPFSLVPVSGTPNVMRHAGPKEVKPGEAIQDTVVFAVPANAELLFRLVLPRPAFSSKLSGAWGYEIGGVALASTPVANGTDPAIPGQPTGPIGRQAIPIPGLQDPPVPVQPAPALPAEPEMKKPEPKERIPIPGLTDEPDKPAKPKMAEEVPNLNPTPAKKK